MIIYGTLKGRKEKMKCPNCNVETDYILSNTAGDYSDGVVHCGECGKLIATFNYVAPYV